MRWAPLVGAIVDSAYLIVKYMASGSFKHVWIALDLHHRHRPQQRQHNHHQPQQHNNNTNNNNTDNNNHLGANGVRIAAKALLTCTGLKRLGLSYNEPGVEPALADLLRAHPALVSVELVEAIDRHLPSRAKDDIGRALTENKAKTLGFLHCDTFVLGQETRSLMWPREASTSDAVLLAGVLVTNTVLTTFNIAAGATLANTARSALGEALLNNPGSRVAFCNDFGLAPSVDNCEFDLSRTELKDVEPFRLLAGCLRGNRTLTHVKLNNLRIELIETLAQALRANDKLEELDDDLATVYQQGGPAPQPRIRWQAKGRLASQWAAWAAGKPVGGAKAALLPLGPSRRQRASLGWVGIVGIVEKCL